MKKILRVLLQFLFPERDDAKIVNSLKAASFANMPLRHQQDMQALLPFSDMRVRACIHEVKFHKNAQAASLLAHVLHTHIAPMSTAIIVPIPLSDKRQRERGYNQVTLVAKHAVKNTSHVLDEDIIYRAIHTPPQTTLSRSNRIKNMKGVFAVFDHKTIVEKIHGADIILLDDVTTTGATLSAAKATLLPHHPNSITCIALAH